MEQCPASSLLDMPGVLRNSWRPQINHPYHFNFTTSSVPSGILHTNTHATGDFMRGTPNSQNITLPPMVIPSDFEIRPEEIMNMGFITSNTYPLHPIHLLVRNPEATSIPTMSCPSTPYQETRANQSCSGVVSNPPSSSASSSSSSLPSSHPSQQISTKSVGYKYINVTPYLHLPQHEAAKELGVPSSTLSKRWREATMNRNWPHRILRKLDKQIHLLIKNAYNIGNCPFREGDDSQSQQHERNLGYLLAKRREEAKVVFVRL